jgi:hypothetical protein
MPAQTKVRAGIFTQQQILTHRRKISRRSKFFTTANPSRCRKFAAAHASSPKTPSTTTVIPAKPESQYLHSVSPPLLRRTTQQPQQNKYLAHNPFVRHTLEPSIHSKPLQTKLFRAERYFAKKHTRYPNASPKPHYRLNENFLCAK